MATKKGDAFEEDVGESHELEDDPESEADEDKEEESEDWEKDY